MKLKVKPLAWYMEEIDDEELHKQYVPVGADFALIGRNGHYCYGDNVWFEINGKGYFSYWNQTKAREYFCYEFIVNDEAILPAREVTAMEQVLNTTRDAAVRKAILKRLRFHYESQQLRDVGRRASKFRISVIGR